MLKKKVIFVSKSLTSAYFNRYCILISINSVDIKKSVKAKINSDVLTLLLIWTSKFFR